MSKAKKAKKRAPTADELEAHFDAGGDITDHADPSRAVWRINLDLPIPMKAAIDAEADRLGVNRQALIKILIDDALESRKSRRAAG